MSPTQTRVLGSRPFTGSTLDWPQTPDRTSDLQKTPRPLSGKVCRVSGNKTETETARTLTPVYGGENPKPLEGRVTVRTRTPEFYEKVEIWRTPWVVGPTTPWVRTRFTWVTSVGRVSWSVQGSCSVDKDGTTQIFMYPVPWSKSPWPLWLQYRYLCPDSDRLQSVPTPSRLRWDVFQVRGNRCGLLPPSLPLPERVPMRQSSTPLPTVCPGTETLTRCDGGGRCKCHGGVGQGVKFVLWLCLWY